MADPQTTVATFTAHDLVLPALTVTASFIATWIAAQLALGNFYRERIWERKADAYTKVFEALHDIERWHSKHLDAAMEGRDIPEQRRLELQRDANKAEQDLERTLAGQVWILPPAFYNRSLRLTDDLQKSAIEEKEWVPFLERSIHSISETTRYLKGLVRSDLRTDRA
jgi:hypothetical protein